MTKEEMIQYALKSDDTVENVMWNIYQQGRADAIDEFAEAIRKYIGNNGVIPINKIAEQLKEQTNE